MAMKVEDPERSRNHRGSKADLLKVVNPRSAASEILWTNLYGTAKVWRVARGEYRIQTSDRRIARRLARLTDVDNVGSCLVGGTIEILALSSRKLRTAVVIGILTGERL